MNTFSLRVSTLLLSASLVCAPMCAMEEEVGVMQVVLVEDVNSDVMFEDEGAMSEDQTPEVVWYRRKAVQQRVACAVAAVYVIAVCTGKVRSPLALLTAFGGLFAKKAVESTQDPKKENPKLGENGSNKGSKDNQGADQTNISNDKKQEVKTESFIKNWFTKGLVLEGSSDNVGDSN